MAGGDKRRKVLVLGNVRAEGLDILRDIAELTVLPEPVSGDGHPGLHRGRGCGASQDRKDRRADDVTAGRACGSSPVTASGSTELDLDSIRAAGVPVSTTPGANSNAVAEATVGMALNVLRHLPRGEGDAQAGSGDGSGEPDGPASSVGASSGSSDSVKSGDW